MPSARPGLRALLLLALHASSLIKGNNAHNNTSTAALSSSVQNNRSTVALLIVGRKANLQAAALIRSVNSPSMHYWQMILTTSMSCGGQQSCRGSCPTLL